jgi:leucyl aminopeptidase (aminopeptidase T)
MNKGSSDLDNACLFFLRDILSLKKGNRLLIYIDRGPEEVVADELRRFASSIGIVTEVLQLQDFQSQEQIVDSLCSAIAAGNFDAVCELSDQYFYPTRVWGKAIQLGCRLFSMGSMQQASFIRCIGKVNREKLAEFGAALYDLVKDARRVKLETSAGTHLTFKMNTGSLLGRIATRLKLTTMSEIWEPTGNLGHEGDATFLGGQLSFQGIADTIEGTAVIDGFMWPPDDVGFLKEPIVLKIKQGKVVDIGGEPLKSGVLTKWLEGREKAIEHFCIGFNPGARVSDNLVEAERAYGHINIGIGKYPYHTDGVIRNPRLTINGKVLMDNNAFVHEKLATLEKELRTVTD